LRYHKDTNETVAIKVIDLDYAEDDVDDIMKEIAILAQMNSKYVTRYKIPGDVLTIGILVHISRARNFGLLWSFAEEQVVLIWFDFLR